LDLLEILKKDSNFSIKELDKELIVNKPRRQALKIPKTVNLCGELLRSLFLIFGDGHYKSKLSLTNHVYRIHMYVIHSFENNLGIPKDVWKLRIIHSQNQDKKFINIVKRYWTRVLEFDDNQLYPTISSSFGYKTCEEGIARIQIDKMNISEIVKILIEKAISLIKNNKLSEEEYCYILDGILNAEGSVLLDSKGIHRVTISFNKKEKILFRIILLKLIQKKVFKEKEDRFIISKWYFIYQFLKPFVKYNIIPFSLRPRDAHNLISGFLNHKRTQALRNYLETIEKYPNKYFSQIARLSNRDWKSAKQTLQIRTKEFVNIKRVKGRQITRLSEEGKNLLNLIRTLENWLPIISKNLKEDDLKIKQLEVK